MAAPRARTAPTRVQAATRSFPAAVALPSGRSLVIGFALLALAVGLYAGARRPSVFAVRDVRVEGAPRALERQLEQRLASVEGHSLVTLDGDALVGQLESLPTVVSATYDRAFPHSLVVTVVPEQPTAVLRRGVEAWLLSARGRVMARVAYGAHPRLPRIWVPKTVVATIGAIVGDPDVKDAVFALAHPEARQLQLRVKTARSRDGQLTLVLANGLELRLGERTDVPLKLAAARQILPQLAAPAGGGPTYLDLSVPERPVAGTTLESEVEVEG